MRLGSQHDGDRLRVDQLAALGQVDCVTYSRNDLDFADQLRVALQGFGFGVTIDRDDSIGGDAWKKRLSDLIRDADTVVFVLSPSSANSPTCAWEVKEAVVLGKREKPTRKSVRRSRRSGPGKKPSTSSIARIGPLPS